MGQLEPSLALTDGAGERPFLVAEQLALEQRFRQGRAVDGDEREIPPRRSFVHGPRDQLLAGAGLAEDQDGADRLGHMADQLEHVVHPRAFAQDAMEGELLVQLLAQRGDFVGERALSQGSLHHELQMLEVDRLGQKIGGTHAASPAPRGRPCRIRS